MNWDDLRIIAAVRDEGTYAAAGARLRIDETTVARRVARIQQDLGVALFSAVDGVRKPTTHCEAVLAHVQEIARHVAEIGNVRNSGGGPSGKFRIASTSTLAEKVLTPRAAPFLLAHPGLSLQIRTSIENVNFSRWEADLAIRLRKPDRGDFTITKLVDMRLYMFEPISPAEAAGGPLVCGFPEELDHTPEVRHLVARRLHAEARFVTGDYRIVREFIRSHAAIGVLPEYLCAGLLADPELRATLLAARREVWLLVQNHLRRDPAARLVIDWVRDSFNTQFAR